MIANGVFSNLSTENGERLVNNILSQLSSEKQKWLTVKRKLLGEQSKVLHKGAGRKHSNVVL